MSNLRSDRPTWDELFLEMCDVVAQRATCDRKHVGAVLVRDNRVIATGYNGSIPGAPHCDDPDTFWHCDRCGKKSIDKPRQANGLGSLCHDPFCTGNMHERQGGHDMEDGHCVRTVHAEVNVICQAAKLGISTDGTVLYCNTLPCWNCFKTIASSGIVKVVYRDEYRGEEKGRVKEAIQVLPGFKLVRNDA